jgi:hypothetical protein
MDEYERIDLAEAERGVEKIVGDWLSEMRTDRELIDDVRPSDVAVLAADIALYWMSQGAIRARSADQGEG